MTRIATSIHAVAAEIFLMSAVLFSSHLAVGKENGSRLAAGRYTGACQVMIIGSDGTVRYDDTPLGICHLEITDGDMLKAEFPDKNLGRGKWNTVTLKLSTNESRVVWTALVRDDTYKVTAIPYSPKAFVFRLEITNNGKLIAGAQQFYSIEPKHIPPSR